MKDMVVSSVFTSAFGRHTGYAVLCNEGYVIKGFSQAWPGLIMGVHSFLPLNLRLKTEVL